MVEYYGYIGGHLRMYITAEAQEYLYVSGGVAMMLMIEVAVEATVK